ncbi:hypothetical protein DYB26_005113, partial [Aphanomyces astaci]
AYGLMDDDDSASRSFVERDIETILKENAHVRVVNKPVDEEDDVQPKKPKGMMVFDKTSFVAEGSTGDLSVNDPSFWEKVLGHISVEMLSKKLEDGSALASRQTKAKFMAQLQQALGQLIQDVRENKKEKDAFFQHEYEVAVNMLQRLAAIKDQFSFNYNFLEIPAAHFAAKTMAHFTPHRLLSIHHFAICINSIMAPINTNNVLIRLQEQSVRERSFLEARLNEVRVDDVANPILEKFINDLGPEAIPEYMATWACLVEMRYIAAWNPSEAQTGALDAADVERNLRVSSDRVVVENFFGRVCSFWKVSYATFTWGEKIYGVIQRTTFALTNFHLSLITARAEDEDYYAMVMARYQGMANERERKRADTQRRYRMNRQNHDFCRVNSGELAVCIGGMYGSDVDDQVDTTIV